MTPTPNPDCPYPEVCEAFRLLVEKVIERDSKAQGQNKDLRLVREELEDLHDLFVCRCFPVYRGDIHK